MSVVEVRSEPLTYHRGARASYFRDLALRDREAGATARLDRHTREMEVEMRAREDRGVPDGFEYRINPDRSAGFGGNFAPPIWLIEHFATAKRPGRVLADLIKEAGGAFPLPPNVKTVNVPRFTTGEADQAVPSLDEDPDTDIVDALSTSTVVSLAGQSDVALQLLEQSPPGAHLDWAVWKDLTASYDAALEAQLIYGSGTGGQLLGMTNAVGVNAVTYTDASPTLSEVWTFLGQMAAQIGDNRNLPPEVWLMRTARWSWIASSEDSSLRPIVIPQPLGMQPPDPRTATPVLTINGWPVYCDDSIPATLGATANQDEIVACRPSDFLLFEGDPITNVYTEVLSGNLMARIQLRNYAAAIVGLYASGIAVLNGSGMVVQSGF